MVVVLFETRPSMTLERIDGDEEDEEDLVEMVPFPEQGLTR